MSRLTWSLGVHRRENKVLTQLTHLTRTLHIWLRGSQVHKSSFTLHRPRFHILSQTKQRRGETAERNFYFCKFASLSLPTSCSAFLFFFLHFFNLEKHFSLRDTIKQFCTLLTNKHRVIKPQTYAEQKTCNKSHIYKGYHIQSEWGIADSATWSFWRL